MIRAVVFDLDGTLIEQAIDFDGLRRDLGTPHAFDILDHMASMTPSEREKAERILESHEDRAARCAALAEGAAELLAGLAAQGLPFAIVTRNSRRTLRIVKERFQLRWTAAVSREDAPAKPSPEPTRRAARALGCPPGSVMVVGDYAFDTESAIAAGAVAVYLSHGLAPRRPTRAHFVIPALQHVLPLISDLCSGKRPVGEPRPVGGGG